MEDTHHDTLELPVHFLEGPAQALGVLAHLQSGGGHAAGVGGLAGQEVDAFFLEVLGGIQRGGHIGTLADGETAVGHQGLGILQQQLVLSGAGQGNIALDGPHALALVVDGIGTGLGVLRQTGPLDLLHFDQGGYVNAVGIVDPAGGIGAGNGLGTQLPGLLNGVGGYVAGTGDGHDLSLQVLAVALEHLFGDVEQAVACGLGTGQAAAVAQSLSGEHALVLAAEALVLAEQVADLPAAHTDVTGGHILVGTDVLVELRHEALAEGHDLPVGLALGVEVSAALAAADGQAGEGILEHLLKAQEFQNALVDAGVEPKAALIGADGGVELDPVAVVHLDLALVVYPGDPEHDDPLRGSQPLQKGVLAVGCLILLDDHLQGLQHLGDGLQEFRLAGVLSGDPLQNFIHITHRQLFSSHGMSGAHCSRFDREMQGKFAILFLELAKIPLYTGLGLGWGNFCGICEGWSVKSWGECPAG